MPIKTGKAQVSHQGISLSLSFSLYLGLALSRLIIDQSLQAELWYNHGNCLERVSVSVQGGPCKYLKYLTHTHDGPQLVAPAHVNSSDFVISIFNQYHSNESKAKGSFLL